MGRSGSERLRIAIVGGGPGGLFAALLAKQRMPQHEVIVYERNAPDATFGFGVVFSARTLGGFAEADSRLVADMAAAGVSWDDIEVRRNGHSLRCGGHGFSAVSRRSLLLLLQDRAREVGVDLRFEYEPQDSDLAGADLVVAADGANSELRRRHEGAFGAEVDRSAARFIWFATRQSFDALTFIFVDNEHGQWGLHAYPFEQGTSTFIVETDEQTWRRAGLDAHQDLPPGVSDMESLRYCEELFADDLGGHPVLENNSKWLQFGTLRCRSWHDGNLVLLGDAAHTAHFSVGSGTKMAMEDAVALVDALAEVDEVPAALARYEERRRPAVAHIQAAAAPSLVWWERFRLLADRTDEEFTFHFLTRSPGVTRQRLSARDWRFVGQVERRLAKTVGGDPLEGPLAAPLKVGPLRLPGRLAVVAGAGPTMIEEATGAALFGAGLVLVPDGEGAADAADRIHGQTAAAVALLLGEGEVPSDAGPFDLLAVAGPRPDLERWPAASALLLLHAAPEDPAGAAADQLLEELRSLAATRTLLVGVVPAAAGEPGLPQLEFCDRLRDEAGIATVLVDGPGGADGAATAVLAGRADVVLAAPSLSSERWGPSGVMVGATVTDSV
jgi:2-polyprenyl-6-methoxyphenol hydroxylase-like FAD-dependent oxidoreductase